MTSWVLTYVLNLCVYIMTSYRVSLWECMSYENNFIISKNLSDNLSHKAYDGWAYRALVRHMVNVVGSCERHGLFEEYMTYVLFVYTLPGYPMHCCATLPEKYIHSLSHLATKIDHYFNHFNHKALAKEIMELWKAPDESIEYFHTHFCNLSCQFLEDEIDWEFLKVIFEYLLYISKNPQFLKSFESFSACFGDGAV